MLSRRDGIEIYDENRKQQHFHEMNAFLLWKLNKAVYYTGDGDGDGDGDSNGEGNFRTTKASQRL